MSTTGGTAVKAALTMLYVHLNRTYGMHVYIFIATNETNHHHQSPTQGALSCDCPLGKLTGLQGQNKCAVYFNMDLRKTWYTAQYQSLEQQDAVPLLVRMLYPRLLFPPKFTCTTRNHEPRPRTVPTFSLNLTFACHFCFLFWLDRAYVFLKFNICLSLLFPILVRSRLRFP